ncbi:MAG TPA: PKD domain-containing protein [Gemmatimonadales bacterium]|nr:PKD domain-containing protein [Gemmatimonadales bacterium]
MNGSRLVGTVGWILGLLVFGCARDRDPVGPPLFQLTQVADVEPNNTCSTGQDLGPLGTGLAVNGSLDPEPPATGDIDFLRIAGTPNSVVTINLEGQATANGTLENPFFGVLDGDCNVIAFVDDGGEGTNARALITLPASGILTVAATACCDFGLNAGGVGTYELTIEPYPAPANDDFANAIVIAALPFTDVVDLTGADVEPDEPTSSCRNFSGFARKSAWYSFTPTETGWVSVENNRRFSGVAAVYSGASLSELVEIGCDPLGERVAFLAEAGTQYAIQVHGWFDAGGLLELRVNAIPRPPNDDFANATTLTTLPSLQPLDLAAATVEEGEQQGSCTFLGNGVTRTAWYAFTPTTTGSISVSETKGVVLSAAVAYTGTSLFDLVRQACQAGFFWKLTFRATAGTTYYIQLGGYDDQRSALEFLFEPTPLPVPTIQFFSPGDPSVFDPIQFVGSAFDPGQLGLETETWDFGDGATGTSCCPGHQYATDGDYTVRYTVTTPDGRTASTTGTVPVRTHDVAITKVDAPTTALVGQTRTVGVSVRNARYPETVGVQLFKGTPGGFVFVDQMALAVPARPGARTTEFNFRYTFTPEDGVVGKVTFKAVAILLSARDALPPDNEATAAPTNVRR